MKFPDNPFPGMNPWLEGRWGDVHTSLTTYSRDRIQKQLPGDLRARVEEYPSVTEAENDVVTEHRIAPDVSVTEQSDQFAVGGGVAVQELTASEPVVIRIIYPTETLRSIRIVDTGAKDRVITAIEFLSRSNKVGQLGQKQYRTKRQQLLDAGVNLVEVDLLREGGWVIAASQDCYPRELQHPYRVCVIRAKNPVDAEVYKASCNAPLPNIRIPLRPTDKDVILPLQALLNEAFMNGRYAAEIDYSQPPVPPLEDVDQKQISEFLATKAAAANS